MKGTINLFKKHKYNLLGIIIAIFLSLSLYYFRESFKYFSNLGYFGLFVTSLVTNATVFIPIPYIPVVVIAGGILNPFFVALVVGIGSAIGELTGYLTGASGGQILADSPKFMRVKSFMAKYGLWTIFFLSFVPNFIFDVAGLISGATKVPVYRFLLAAAAGKFMRYLLIAYFGYFSIAHSL